MHSKVSRPTQILISGAGAVVAALIVGVYTTRAAAAQLSKMEASPDCPPAEGSEGRQVLDVVRVQVAAPR